MSIKELKELLMVKNVPQDLYSLEGGLPSESYCIEKTEDKWHLYYSERGVKETINYYDTEDEVVDAFLSEIVVYWHSSLYFLVQSQTDVLDILNSAAISA